MAGKRRFGRVRKLPSGRWQARYLGPDGVDRAAPHTFERKVDADRWLARQEDELLVGQWVAPETSRVLLRDYAVTWLSERSNLRPKTRQLYEGLIRLHIAPTLGALALSDITPARVRTWFAGLTGKGLGPVTAAKAYRLLNTIMGTALEDRLIRENPCRVKGASVERSAERTALSADQVFALADAMPARFRMLVLVSTFGSLRWGEAVALRRSTVDLQTGLVQVRSTLVEMGDGSLIIGPPKTAAGRRTVALPASLLENLRRNVELFLCEEDDALLFVGPQGAPLRRSNFQRHWRTGLTGAGLTSDTHFHDLRHTGNTLAARQGANLRDLMARMGHASTRAALLYLHTESDRDRAIAAGLDTVVAAAHRARNGHDAS